MSATAFRPEFGPSLPALVRRLPRTARLALAGLAALAVVLLIAAAVARDDVRSATAVVEGPVAFNLIWQEDGLRRVPPGPGELLRLRSAPGAPFAQSYVVRRLRLPAYRGEVGGFLPLFTTSLVDEMRKRLPAFRQRSEGRARINELPGYQIVFQTRLQGRVAYGRRVLLVPDEPGVRDGADIELISARSPAVPRAEAVGNNGALKTPLRSFRFGTERP